MKKLTKLLARFILFSAAECAILFGLPALATPLHSVGRFPARFDPVANPKAAKHRTTTHRKAA